MRSTRTFKLALLTAALAAMAFAPAAGAVTSNGKKVAVKVHCAGTAGTTTPGTLGGDDIYNPYGPPNPSPGTPGSSTAGTGCQGTIILKAVAPKAPKKATTAKKAKRVKIGSTSFSLSAGQTKSVAVKLGPTGRHALASAGKLKASVIVKSDSAVSVPKQLKVKLKKKKPKK
jgi:hypothetical protein